MRILSALMLSTLLFGSFAQADVCVSNMQEYNALKQQLPKFLQNIPATFVADGTLASAAMKIRPAGDKLKLEGYVSAMGSVSVDDGYVKKACYNGKSLVVILENGKPYEAKIKGDYKFSISGATFEKSTDARFASMVNSIKPGALSLSSTSSPSVVSGVH